MTPEQADVLALALALPVGEALTLTAIRSLGISTTQQARAVADHLVRQQLLEPLSETRFQLRDAVRQRFAQEAEQVLEQVGTEVLNKSEPSGDEVTPEVTPEVLRMLAIVTGAMSRGEIMTKLGLKDEKHFREHYQQAGISGGVIEMTIPDKPQSSKQRYRLTDKGKALRGEVGE